MHLIASLYDFYQDGGRRRDFAFDYAGSYVPPRQPHLAKWPLANEHWLKAVAAFLDSAEFDPARDRRKMIDLAQEYVMAELWEDALDGVCYACPAVASRTGGTRRTGGS